MCDHLFWQKDHNVDHIVMYKLFEKQIKRTKIQITMVTTHLCLSLQDSIPNKLSQQHRKLVMEIIYILIKTNNSVTNAVFSACCEVQEMENICPRQICWIRFVPEVRNLSKVQLNGKVETICLSGDSNQRGTALHQTSPFLLYLIKELKKTPNWLQCNRNVKSCTRHRADGWYLCAYSSIRTSIDKFKTCFATIWNCSVSLILLKGPILCFSQAYI